MSRYFKFDFEKEDFLFILFGIPTWILFNGTWAGLSQIAVKVPEGFDISSYLTISSMCGNIFPFILGNCYLQNASPQALVRVINIILIIGFIGGIFVCVFWDYSVTAFGKELSIPLFALFFVIGSVCASSNVTHFTFVSKFRYNYYVYIF